MRRAFTIIELMMVVAIIAVLVTIVSFVANGALSQARQDKANAIRKVVQQGIDVYHAQKGEWPIGGLDGRSPNDNSNSRYILDKNEVRQCMRALLDECKKGNPMFDVSGLFVTREEPVRVVEDEYPFDEFDCAKYGLDFMSAVRGTKRTGRKMKVSEMWFGCPCKIKAKKKDKKDDEDSGIVYGFVTLKIGYNFASDSLEVIAPVK